MNLNQPPDQIVEVAPLAADGSVADSVAAVAGLAGIGMGEGMVVAVEGMAVEVARPAEVRLKLSTKIPRCFG